MKRIEVKQLLRQVGPLGLLFSCAVLFTLSCKNQDEINLHMQRGNALFNEYSYAGYDRALDQYRTVYELDRKHFEALSRMGFICAVLVGEFGAPIDLLTEGTKYIDEADALNQHSSLLVSAKALLIAYGNGNRADAVQLLQNALESDQESSLLHTTLGYVLLNLNAVYEASKELTKGMQPNEIRSLIGLGRTAMHRSRYAEAGNFFSMALKSNSNHVTSLLNKGLLALLRGNTPADNNEADAVLKKIKPNLENTASHFEKRLAQYIEIILTIRGPKRAKGLEQLTAMLAKEKDGGLFFFIAAREYRRHGMLTEATDAIKKSLGVKTPRPDFALEQAAIFLDSKNYEAARYYALRIHSQDPGNLESLLIAGDAYIGEKNFENALEYFNQAKNADPTFAPPYARIGTNTDLVKLVGKEASYANCEKYLQLDPQGEDAAACQKALTTIK
jgi:tetratricopeptide (TPR) repeat protein